MSILFDKANKRVVIHAATDRLEPLETLQQMGMSTEPFP